MADDYMLAARNKIASATRHLAALEKLRAGDESERSQIQDAYEGIISRGFSAGDQLARSHSRPGCAYATTRRRSC